MKGKIYMLPVTLGNHDTSIAIPEKVRDITLSLRLFAVEDVRSSRRYLRGLDKSFPIDDSLFFEIGKHSHREDLKEFFSKIAEGYDAGVMSEAGMPGLADPGNIVVEEAHKQGLRVIPLAGPSSIMLALVASGLNGQSFAFNGYLPPDVTGRQKAVKELEKKSVTGQTQIFMETPFRAEKMFNDILSVCKPTTRLCIAADISLENEEIMTMTIQAWKNRKQQLDNRLVVFLLLA